jgi:hypothetical protein
LTVLKFSDKIFIEPTHFFLVHLDKSIIFFHLLSSLNYPYIVNSFH